MSDRLKSFILKYFLFFYAPYAGPLVNFSKREVVANEDIFSDVTFAQDEVAVTNGRIAVGWWSFTYILYWDQW